MKQEKEQEDELLKSLIGKELEVARTLTFNAGYKSRVVCTDGKHHIITMDMRLDRVNFTIENNIVTKVDIG